MKTLSYAFRFKSRDLFEIHQHLMAWRAELRDLHHAAFCKLLGGLAVKMFDEEVLVPGSHAGKMPYMEAITSVWDRQKKVKATNERDPLVDFEFNMVIMPHSTGVYGNIYTEQHAWRDLWLSKDFVEDFSYWSSSDCPDEISEKEWSHRSAVWNEILNSAILSAPSMAGFNADCTHDAMFPRIDEVMSAVPTFAARLKYHAKNAVMNAEFARRSKELAADGPEGQGPQLLGLAGKVNSWLGTREGRSRIQAEKYRLSGILPEVITREMLIDKIGLPVPEVSDEPTAPDGVC